MGCNRAYLSGFIPQARATVNCGNHNPWTPILCEQKRNGAQDWKIYDPRLANT